MKRILAIFGMMLLLSSCTAEEVAEFLLNNDRVNVCAEPALGLDRTLQQTANSRVLWMATTENFVHTVDLTAGIPYKYDWTGENIAWRTGFRDETENNSLVIMEQALMNSPHHRENICYPAYTAIGIGVHWNSDHTKLYEVQVFAGVF
jgi:uncharacterized protein YkwD